MCSGAEAFAIAEEDEAARHVIEESGRNPPSRSSAPPRRRLRSRPAPALRRQRPRRPVRHHFERHELPGVGDLGGDVVGGGRARCDDPHLALDLGADFGPEAAGVAEDASKTGQRVAGVDGQVERPVEPTNPRHRNAERDTDHNGGNQAVDHNLQALRQKVRQFAGNGRFIEGYRDVTRRGEKDRADKGGDNLPDDQDGNDKAVTVERGVLPPGRFDHSLRLRAAGDCAGVDLLGNSHRHPFVAPYGAVRVAGAAFGAAPAIEELSNAADGGIEGVLKELGIELPEVPKPVAVYLPAKTVGNLVYTSGQDFE